MGFNLDLGFGHWDLPVVAVHAKIIESRPVSKEYRKLTFSSPGISRSALPGQFVHVLVEDDAGLLLRRPFSILSAENGNVSFVYKVVGKGTELLSKKGTQDLLNVVGPLGNPYGVDSHTQHVILVAGGYGVSPTLFLATQLKKKKFKGKVTTILGARTRELLLCVKEFQKLGVQMVVTTGDGSAGKKGLVTDALQSILLRAKKDSVQIFACGPNAMLHAVAKAALKHHVPAQLSMEQQLGCGLGACLGCVIETKHGFERVCTEGPVFDAQNIVWTKIQLIR